MKAGVRTELPLKRSAKKNITRIQINRTEKHADALQTIAFDDDRPSLTASSPETRQRREVFHDTIHFAQTSLLTVAATSTLTSKHCPRYLGTSRQADTSLPAYTYFNSG